MATPPEKGSRTPAGKPTIQCPDCGEWVLLERGVGTPPYRQFTCRQGHRFGLAQAGNGHGHAHDKRDTEPNDAPSKPKRVVKAAKASKAANVAKKHAPWGDGDRH